MLAKQIQKETSSSSIVFCDAVFIWITGTCSLELQFTLILNDPQQDLSMKWNKNSLILYVDLIY